MAACQSGRVTYGGAGSPPTRYPGYCHRPYSASGRLPSATSPHRARGPLAERADDRPGRRPEPRPGVRWGEALADARGRYAASRGDRQARLAGAREAVIGVAGPPGCIEFAYRGPSCWGCCATAERGLAKVGLDCGRRRGDPATDAPPRASATSPGGFGRSAPRSGPVRIVGRGALAAPVRACRLAERAAQTGADVWLGLPHPSPRGEARRPADDGAAAGRLGPRARRRGSGSPRSTSCPGRGRRERLLLRSPRDALRGAVDPIEP